MSLAGVVGILAVIRTGHFKCATACGSCTVRFCPLRSLYAVSFIVINMLMPVSTSHVHYTWFSLYGGA
jgi:hypothetical protein